MLRLCLVCCALGALASGALCGARLLRVWLAEGVATLAMGEREVSEEMLTKEGLFRKVCRFSQEFLTLAVVEQAIYLIGACGVLLTGY